jgi:hypothetical protein
MHPLLPPQTPNQKSAARPIMFFIDATIEVGVLRVITSGGSRKRLRDFHASNQRRPKGSSIDLFMGCLRKPFQGARRSKICNIINTILKIIDPENAQHRNLAPQFLNCRLSGAGGASCDLNDPQAFKDRADWLAKHLGCR